PKERRSRTGWQQGRQDPRIAEAAGRSHVQGADESDRLAAAFGTRVSVGHRRQEDGIDGHIHQERGRRAQLLAEILNLARKYSFGPPDSSPAAFFVLKD